MFGLLARDRLRKDLRHVCAEASGAHEENYRRAERRSEQLYGAGGEPVGDENDSGVHRSGEEGREAAHWREARGGRRVFYRADDYCGCGSQGAAGAGGSVWAGAGGDQSKKLRPGAVIANNTEFGLTGAVYSKNPEKIKKAEEAFHVGNLYLNRKCTGAMVGAHPFGGFNMSGTDSKAGGKDYLLLFMQGKSIAEKVS